jgi:energy-coupling factor transporter ATP-binding protein EcfA2
MYPSVKKLRRDAFRRLRHGEHLVLHGPFGSGKTTLLIELEGRLKDAGVLCARVPATRSLADITHALELMFPSVGKLEHDPQAMRPHPQVTAEGKNGVLLLDHLAEANDAMVEFLHGKLHSGAMGVLTAVDTEVEEKRRRLGAWRLGALDVRMPPTSAEELRELLEEGRSEYQLPPLSAEYEDRLISAARGRPGWILQCIDFARTSSYWEGTQLFVSQLSDDTERALGQRVIDLLRGEDTPRERADQTDLQPR